MAQKTQKKRGGRRRKKRRISLARRKQVALALSIIAVLTAAAIGAIIGRDRDAASVSRGLPQPDTVNVKVSDQVLEENQPEIELALLTPNPYSRPQLATDEITGIVIHYVGNPGSSAMANRDYFEGLKSGANETYASSHFIVGLEGEIVQCIPTAEVAYASNDRNHDTIAIEVCHPDQDGRFSDVTYASLVHLTGWLCEYLEVHPSEIIRHYDVSGKKCPKYYVEHEDAWETFKQDVTQWVADHQ